MSPRIKDDGILHNGILIKKDGIYHRYWNSGLIEKKADNLFLHLHREIKIMDDVTFEDFFNLIMKDADIFSAIFYSHLGGYNLSNWKEEWNKPFEKKEVFPWEDMRYLEVHWVAEIWNDNPLEDYSDFGGCGYIKDKDIYKDDEWHETSFGIGFSALNELKSYPFKLNDDYKIHKWGNKVKDDSYILKTKKEFSVYDVIGAILYEISWYGTPEERDEVSNDLVEQVKELENEFEKNPNILKKCLDDHTK